MSEWLQCIGTLTNVDHCPPWSRRVYEVWIRLVRQQFCQFSSSFHTSLSRLGIKINRAVALIVYPPLNSTETGSRDEYLDTPVVHPKQELLAMEILWFKLVLGGKSTGQGNLCPIFELVKQLCDLGLNILQRVNQHRPHRRNAKRREASTDFVLLKVVEYTRFAITILQLKKFLHKLTCQE